MNASKQAAWLVVALSSLACSGWYFASATPMAKLDERTLTTTADMVVHQLTVHQFDKEGRLVNYLQAPLMHHIPLNNTHWLQTPHIIVTQENQPAWEIHAKQATAVNGGQQIMFKKHVVVHQEKDEHNQESTLKTEGLTYFPKSKLATTLLDVTFEQPGHLVRSTGMNAYLAEKRVQLLSEARGTYEPGHG